jgi:hypothetical protein
MAGVCLHTSAQIKLYIPLFCETQFCLIWRVFPAEISLTLSKRSNEPNH